MRSPEVQTWRELIKNQLPQLGDCQTGTDQECGRVVASAGVVPPRQVDLVTMKGLAWLCRLAPPTSFAAIAAGSHARRDRDVRSPAPRIERQLNHQSQHSSAVACLQSIPGVGVRTAEATAAFVDNSDRFPHTKAVGRCFGLVPSKDQSGDRNRLGRITREGAPVVRRLVDEASWRALRRSPTVRAYFGAPNDETRSERKWRWWTRPIFGAGDLGHAEARNCWGGESRPSQLSP